jgi:hypothetical protein
LQHKLFKLWEDYDRDKTDTYRLLQKLTRLYSKKMLMMMSRIDMQIIWIKSKVN